MTIGGLKLDIRSPKLATDSPKLALKKANWFLFVSASSKLGTSGFNLFARGPKFATGAQCLRQDYWRLQIGHQRPQIGPKAPSWLSKKTVY